MIAGSGVSGTTGSRGQAFRACASDPGALSRTGLASTGLVGPCERPVPKEGGNGAATA